MPHLADAQAFAAYLAPLRRAEWVVYAKRPFGGPQAVLAYLSRYTHRVAIANSRLIACDEHRRHLPMEGLSRRGSRSPEGHDTRYRRVHPPLPDPRPAHGFHRIRHYGLFASGTAPTTSHARVSCSPLQSPKAEPTAAAVDPGKPHLVHAAAVA